MMVLYSPVMDPNLPGSSASDYQSDMLFHGLRSLYGTDVIEIPYMWWMYQDEIQRRKDEAKQIWGRGFTIYGLLKNFEYDRQQIDPDEFEYCIIPIHHTNILRANRIYTHIAETLKHFPGNKIAVVDGWDRPAIQHNVLNLCQQNEIKYFKRELYEDKNCVYPITFAFPQEKIRTNHKTILSRKYDIAPLIPVNQSIDPKFMQTYKYNDEQDYYDMYEDSIFALTSKKGGWDTLRHYEIIANGCLPIFVDIEACPQNCLWNFPKHTCSRIKHLAGLFLNTDYEQWQTQKTMPHCGFVDMDRPGWLDALEFDYITYYSYRDELRNWLANHGTTKALAKYVMDKLNEN